MKVLHLPTPVGNHGYSLAMAERKAGLDSTSIIIGQNKFNFKTDINIQMPKGWRKIPRLFKTFLHYRKGFDIYHFNFAQTIFDFPKLNMDLLDLQFYDGKKIFTFSGSDIRQLVDRRINRFTPFIKQKNPTIHGLEYDKKKIRLNKILANSDYCFALNPDLMRFLPSKNCGFLPYIKSIWYDIPVSQPYKVHKGPLKLVHAPTNRLVKGSDFLIKAVEVLKKRYQIELILIENMRHAEAIKKYQEADIIIDQLRIGWYGGFALETMKMGKPLVCYINQNDLTFIPMVMSKAVQETIINANISNIEVVLRTLIEDRSILRTYSRNALDFVNTFHNPDKLIKIVIEKYAEVIGL